jgi:DedD protein
MGLLSIFQRKSGDRAKAKVPAPDASPDAVQVARTRARRRLIGAAVLVVIGVIGFPILFETQPRPIPVDIPIEIPRKETAPPLAMPAARAPKPVAAAPVEAPAASAPAELITETQSDAGREVPAAAKPASAHDVAAAKPASASASVPAKVPTPAAKPAESDAAKKDGRFVVQVGAFADAAAARETRQKVEKLGLKTYTQVAETSAGSRIRVRVGPFGSRDEADRAQARIKAAGTPAVVLTL